MLPRSLLLSPFSLSLCPRPHTCVCTGCPVARSPASHFNFLSSGKTVRLLQRSTHRGSFLSFHPSFTRYSPSVLSAWHAQFTSCVPLSPQVNTRHRCRGNKEEKNREAALMAQTASHAAGPATVTHSLRLQLNSLIILGTRPAHNLEPSWAAYLLLSGAWFQPSG